MKLRYWLHDVFINFAERIGKFINKNEFYRQLPPVIVRDTNMSKIESSSCVRNVRIVIPLLNIEREQWGFWSILR